jgi:DNA polymerase III epsilon subunit-like protein
MLACLFDTETTGIYDYRAPASADHQPDVVQLCAMLCDEDKVYSAINVFVHSDSEIPEAAYAVHRIDRAMTARVGISRLRACQLLDSFARKADVLVGHNIDFDIGIMMTATLREGGKGESLKKPRFCTMKEAVQHCKLPNPKRPGTFKWPSLQEAYTILIDQRGFSGAHDAMADARATYELYRVLVSNPV